MKRFAVRSPRVCPPRCYRSRARSLGMECRGEFVSNRRCESGSCPSNQLKSLYFIKLAGQLRTDVKRGSTNRQAGDAPAPGPSFVMIAPVRKRSADGNRKGYVVSTEKDHRQTVWARCHPMK